jgi:polysaccharide biosynthesis/export protein
MRLCLISWLMMVCAACSSSAASQLPEATTPLSPPDRSSIGLPADSDVAPLDILQIKVFNVPELDGAYQVEPDGTLKMPLIGAIKADGFNVFELADELEKRLEENYLQNPIVTVSIAEAYGGQFTTEGAVRLPGPYPVRGKLSLMEAISLSGGLGPDANPQAIVIFRTLEGQRKAARFDLTKIRRGEIADPQVYDKDIILVDGRATNRTYEEVLRSLPLVGLFVAVF